MEDNRENDHKEDKVSTLMQTVGKLAITATALSPFIALTNVEAAPTVTSTPASGNYYFPTMSDSINISPYFTLPTSHGATYEVYYQDTGSWHMLPTSGSLHYFDDSTVPYGTKHLWGKATDEVDSVSASVYWDVELTTIKSKTQSPVTFQLDRIKSLPFSGETGLFDIFPSTVSVTASSEDPNIITTEVVDSMHQVDLHGQREGSTKIHVIAKDSAHNVSQEQIINVQVTAPYVNTELSPITVFKGEQLKIESPRPDLTKTYSMYVISAADLFHGIDDGSADAWKQAVMDIGQSGDNLDIAFSQGLYVCLFYDQSLDVGIFPDYIQYLDVIDPIAGLTDSTNPADVQSIVKYLQSHPLDLFKQTRVLELIRPKEAVKSLIPSIFLDRNTH